MDGPAKLEKGEKSPISSADEMGVVDKDPKALTSDEVYLHNVDDGLREKELDWAMSLAGDEFGSLLKRLLSMGVEYRGIWPVPISQRTDKNFAKIFFIFFAMNFNILSFSAGTVGPLAFGLGLRDSCLVVLFFNLLCSIPPAYFTTWGAKLGLRQMCQARYSFGYFGVAVPSIFNLASLLGFTLLNCILGGQTLASVSDDNMSWSVGIVIVAIVSLLLSFCGYKVLNWYERVSWIPVLIVYLVALGTGGKHLSNPPPATPATSTNVLTYASTIAGFVLTYSPLSSDYTIYMDEKVQSWRLFIYAYLGLIVPIITIQCIGAAFAVSLNNVPAWADAYANGSVGGLLNAVVAPAGGFGKFLTVLLSLSVTANIAPTMYSFGLSFQVLVPICTKVPRYVFSLLVTAIVIPLSIVGAHRFYATLTNFLGLIGYWGSCFVAVILTEHLVFRQRRLSPIPAEADTKQPIDNPHPSFVGYDVRVWNNPKKLPPGIAAVSASICSLGLIIPSMDQVWFVGPIAQTSGDIGFEVAFVLTTLLYIPMRYLEIKITGRL